MLGRRPSVVFSWLGFLLVSIVTAAPAAAQTPLTLGQTVSGKLTASSLTAEDDSYYNLYTFSGRAGERVRIVLRSSDFDAYLSYGRLEAAGYVSIAANDDAAGGTDARLDVTLPATGAYLIRANTLSAGETGAYRLTLEALPQRVDGGGATRPIRSGETASGELGADDPVLGDGSHYHLWSYSGQAGERLRITLRSNDFDAYLAFGRMVDGELDVLQSDDDSGGGTDARIELTLDRTGTYHIRVNSLYDSETGGYTLTVDPASDSGSAGRAGDAGRRVSPSATRISAGRAVTGALTADDPTTFDGTHFDDWLYAGQQGERLLVTMRSTDLDAYLQFGRVERGEFSVLASQDDGAGGTDSLLAFILPADGEYVIRANSLGVATGAYTLQVETNRRR